MKKNILILSCALTFIIGGCQSYGGGIPQAGYTAIYDQSADSYMQQAAQSKPPAKQDFQLQAVGRLLQDRQLIKAQQLLNTLNASQLTPAQINEKTLLTAHLYLLQQQPELALGSLNQLSDVTTLSQNVQIAYYQLMAQADKEMGNKIASAKDLMPLDSLLTGTLQQQNRQTIWQILQQVPLNELNAQLNYATNPTERGWIDLAYIMKAYKNDATVLNSELQNWQMEYPNHPASDLAEHQLAGNPSPAAVVSQEGNIGLLLPQSGNLSYAGQAVRSGVMAAYYNHATSAPSRSIVQYDTATNPSSAYQKAVTAGTSWVIGPLAKPAVTAMAQTSLAVPTLALNYTETVPSSNKLYQFALSPQDEASQAADKAAADGHRHALIIAPASNWGHGVVSAFAQRWQTDGGNITDQVYYSTPSSIDPDIKQLLKVTPGATANAPLMHRQDADVIFLLADPPTARQVMPLLKFYYASDLPVYATSMVYTGQPNATQDRDMDGIQFCDIPFVIENNATIQQAKQ
ncbi:MAG: penicillin-binding protein activator, partial [Gammaproteobacteria bacterium]